jgi:hypothetical protein
MMPRLLNRRAGQVEKKRELFSKFGWRTGPDRAPLLFRHELRGDGFAVALVHLATVSFDDNARH